MNGEATTLVLGLDWGGAQSTSPTSSSFFRQGVPCSKADKVQMTLQTEQKRLIHGPNTVTTD